MSRNSHNLKGLSVNPVPRWRSVFIALVLVLTIGSVSQTAPAQAAPAGDVTSYIWLEARALGSRTICVGEQVVIRVKVYMRVWLDEKHSYDAQLGLAEIKHVVVGSGTVSPNKLPISVTSNSVGAADFTFTAKEPGETTVVFGGTVPVDEIWRSVLSGHDVAGSIDLTIVECEYKVTTISRWNIGPISLVATIKDGKMKLDEQGHLTGTAMVKWETIFNVPDLNAACGGSRDVSVTDSQASFSGDVSDSGQVTVNITYQPTMYSIKGSCSVGPVVDGAQEITPAPLAITVADSGGVSTRAQDLEGQPGSAIIAVFPEK